MTKPQPKPDKNSQARQFVNYLNRHIPESPPRLGFGFPLLKLREGMTIVRMLDKPPVHREIHFESIRGRAVICPEANCIFCLNGDPKQGYFYVNVLHRPANTHKVLSFSDAAARSLKELLRTSTGTPENYDIAFVRTGTGREDTRYCVYRGIEEPLTIAVQLYDLETLLKPTPVEEMYNYLKNNGHQVSVITTSMPGMKVVSQVANGNKGGMKNGQSNAWKRKRQKNNS